MARNFGIDPSMRLRRVPRYDGGDWFPEPDLTWPRVLVLLIALAVFALPAAWLFS